MNTSVKRCLSGVVCSVFIAGCSPPESQYRAPNADVRQRQPKSSLPEYLVDRPRVLYVRDEDTIVNAPAADLSVARRYPEFQDKGKLHKGQRITIMTAKMKYQVGEEVRVIHVLEAPKPELELYVMGPKQIHDEFVDGEPASPARTGLAVYSGRVTKSPDVDFNYEISSYTFDKPGQYTIQWKGAGHPIQGNLDLESNLLRITVTK